MIVLCVDTLLRVRTCVYLHQSLSAQHHATIDTAGLSTYLCYSLVQLLHSCYARDILVTYGRDAMQWYNNARGTLHVHMRDNNAHDLYVHTTC